jgi:hypothetical protein
MNRAALCCAACVLLFPTVTNASVFVLSDSAQGWLTSAGGVNGNSSANNYIAGNADGGTHYRDHFDFSIPSLPGVLTSATLSLTNPSFGFFGGHGGGVNTYSVSSLGSFGSYSWANIGTGTPYGSVNIGGNGLITIPLNGAALATIAAHQGGTFSLGGVDSGENTPNWYDFGFSGGNRNTLTLNVVGVAPSITSPASTTFALGQFGTFTVTDTGTPTPSLSESGALPSGVSFDSSTGVLSGVPNPGSGGVYDLTFFANNGVNTQAVQNFELTVTPEPTSLGLLCSGLGLGMVVVARRRRERHQGQPCSANS